VNRLWLAGLLTRRRGRLAAAAFGIAVAVALLACLGMFFAASQRTMTQRAAQGVAVDWQVEVQSPDQVSAVRQAVQDSAGTTGTVEVGVADTTGLQATTGGTSQLTGSGKVLGLPPTYTALFPTAIRPLTGSGTGVLLAQQTAANLHVGPGGTIEIGRQGLKPYRVQVDGVVELPQIDSLFQKVGAPPQSQPAAPPDNVVLLPTATFRKAFDPLARTRPDLVRTQIHAQRNRSLPPAPADAFAQTVTAANNLEAATAGAGVVGNNLAAALDAARGDALYSQILFLFLGAPGALLAIALSAAVAATGSGRRRQEQSLLRARGATRSQLLRLVVLEAVLIGAFGGALGLLAAAAVGWLVFGSARFGATSGAATAWMGSAFLLGLMAAAAVVILPARRDLREASVSEGLAVVGGQRKPIGLRYGVDLLLVLASLSVFYSTSRSKYALVLAPEGVPAISVNYWAFLGPALLWVGSALLTWRVCDTLLDRGRPLVARGLRPLLGNLNSVVAAAMSRQRRVIVRSAVLVGLALSFAFSTATFNATYAQQAEVDAQLTNGADVTVTEPPGATVPPAAGEAFAGVPGVIAVQPLQHRFAYVGADLQDLYGIDAARITTATTMQDPYFQGGTAQEILSRLTARPDGILVSAETVKDFQLNPGDQLRLRLQDTKTRRYHPVSFAYVGIVNEFPTAPKDSFLVANAAYIAKQTGNDSIGAFLIDTGGKHVTTVASALKENLGTAAKVTTINDSRSQVGSSLTSVDLSGLTRFELAFAFLIAAAAGGLVSALGLTERRRTLTIASALGGSRRQLGSFSVGESTFVLLAGLISGAAAGSALSFMLVTVLTGVFDPPPANLAFPGGYLVGVALATVAAVAAAAALTSARAQRHAVQHLREL
jgi:putative ABC transport system permease protein